MLSCKEVVKILNTDRELSFTKKMGLRMHIFMCKHCKAYKKHLEILRREARKLIAKDSQTDPETIKELEKKVYEKLKKN